MKEIISGGNAGVQRINDVFHIVNKVENVLVYTHIFDLIDNVEYVVYALYSRIRIYWKRIFYSENWKWKRAHKHFDLKDAIVLKREFRELVRMKL